jgi:hypothetical protein
LGAIECDQTRANPADRQILPLAATSMLTGSPFLISMSKISSAETL